MSVFEAYYDVTRKAGNTHPLEMPVLTKLVDKRLGLWAGGQWHMLFYGIARTYGFLALKRPDTIIDEARRIRQDGIAATVRERVQEEAEDFLMPDEP